MLFVFRTLHGAAAANISTAQARVADVTPRTARKNGLIEQLRLRLHCRSVHRRSLSVHGLAALIWLAAGLAALNFVLALAWLKETRKLDTVRPERSIHPGHSSAWPSTP